MTDPKHTSGSTKEDDEDLDPEALAAMEEEAPALSALLKRSLDAPKAAEKESDDVQQKQLLAAVQRKLRDRSKGKFYGDGWSTTQSRVNYTLIAAIMLVTIVAVYLALGPMGISLN